MITISDEIVNHSGLDGQRFKIKLAVMMYETQLMTLPQAATFVGISNYDMQHHIGIRGIKIRWEEDFSRKKGKRKGGGLVVKYMSDDFNEPLELIESKKYQTFIEQIEELENIIAYDKAKAQLSDTILLKILLKNWKNRNRNAFLN